MAAGFEHLKLGATSRGTELLLTQKRDESGLGEAGGARAGLSRKRGGAGPGGIMAEAEGEIRAIVDSEFPLEDAAAAHQRMEDGENIGKILLRVAADS